MDVRVEVKDSSYREGGWHAVEMSESSQAALYYPLSVSRRIDTWHIVYLRYINVPRASWTAMYPKSGSP